MSRYLVTGGCGFIGSHLVDALVQDGHTVRVLDDLSTGTVAYLPAGVELVRASVADAAAVEAALAGADGCFHLAAIASVQRSAEDLLGTHRVNLGGTIALLDAIRCRPEVVPLVYASSAAVYGDHDAIPVREDAPKTPRSPYGVDKFASELHAIVAADNSAAATTGLRFFNVYGPRQPPGSPYSGVVSIFADRLGRGEAITVYGGGLQVRDFVYVADVVQALRRAMELRLAGGPVFNVCTGRGTSVMDLAAALGRLLGREPAIQHAPARPGDIRRSVGDPAAARGALGLREPVALEVGLRSLLESTGR